MPTLRHDLEVLTKLNEYRERTLALRDRGFAWLNAISRVEPEKRRTRAVVVTRVNLPQNETSKWLGLSNKLEAALLMKVQRNLHMTRSEDDFAYADQALADTIEKADMGSFLPSEVGPEGSLPDRHISTLVAANAMQVLTRHASTALSAHSLCCYYRILHELNLAMRPYGGGSTTRYGDVESVSSFITGECMRAILVLEQVHRSTSDFLFHTYELNRKFLALDRVLVIVSHGNSLDADHPLQLWADKALERVWLNWLVSINAHHGEICFPAPPVPDGEPTFTKVKEYLQKLPLHLANGMDEIARQTTIAQAEILEHLGKERSQTETTMQWETSAARAHRSVREHVDGIINDSKRQAEELAETVRKLSPKPGGDDHLRLLDALKKQFTLIADAIHRVLDPSTRYVEGVLGHAIADSETQLDAGELVFAACSYGAGTNWQSRSRQYLRRACAILLRAVPENGVLYTRQPFHSTPLGYKLFPTSCEMVRCLAVLIEKTEYDLDETEVLAIGRILDAIDHRKIDLYNEKIDRDQWYGWNFDGAIEQYKPSVRVSCITVLSLDRIKRMLDSRINAMILRHFDVIYPAKRRSEANLNDLIYSDYGFTLSWPSPDEARRTPIATSLEEMRAHLMRVRLAKSRAGKLPFSAVLYGPPETGKTTLAEALALSSDVPMVRISPSDLTAEPEESVESRGRVIFDALSMLTGAVVLFDEFESVLPDRHENQERSLQFLLTGLLPKLVKLHNCARSQALVYFLATNHIERIDPAAIRRGRFDLQSPVYTPDTLSRTVACLYRLQVFRDFAKGWKGGDVQEWTKDDWKMDVNSMIRLLNIVGATAGVPPTELAMSFFPLSRGKSLDLSRDDWMTSVPYFAHILVGYETTDVPPHPPEMKDEPAPPGANRWVREQLWLNRFEQSFQRCLREEMQRLAGRAENARAQVSPPNLLKACLRPPSSPL